MSFIEKVDINPFRYSEVGTSYSYNVGNLYPVIVVSDTDKSVSIYDGILSVDSEDIKLVDYKIGELCFELEELGLNVRIFDGADNIEAVQLVNFSNSDIVKTKIEYSPIDAGIIKSGKLINNIFDNYKDNVDIKILRDNTSSISFKHGKIFTPSDDLGKEIYTTHFAKTFMLNVSDINIIRNIDNVLNNKNVKAALINANIDIKGKDNAGYQI